MAAATASPSVGAPGVPLSSERSGLGPWQWCARDVFPEVTTTVIVAPALSCPKSQSSVFPATSAAQSEATFVGAGAVLVAEISVQVSPPSFGSTSSSVTRFAVELPVFVITIVKVPGEPAAMVPAPPPPSGSSRS